VADPGNNRIQKFDSNGKFIAKWGTEGQGDGQFFHPRGIAVDSFKKKYLTNGIAVDSFKKKYLTNGIAVDSSRNVYVADPGNNRIQKFDSNGKFIAKWGTEGQGEGQFDFPNGITVDSSGNVYVADTYNDRIEMFRQGALEMNKPTSVSLSSYVSELSGKDEIPPIEIEAAGKASFKIAGNKMEYVLNLRGITDPIGAHLHNGTTDQNGDVVADLLNPNNVNGTVSSEGIIIAGSITSSDLKGPMKGKSLDNLAEAIDKGELYINIHTSKYPAGAIRGQIGSVS
jgi:hypothetical protein